MRAFSWAALGKSGRPDKRSASGFGLTVPDAARCALSSLPTEFVQGLVTLLKAKARNMRAFSWAALGKSGRPDKRSASGFGLTVPDAARCALSSLLTEFMQGLVTLLKAKARTMRAFSWTALGKGCIRIRQNRTESDVIQDTLFCFFLQKGGLKCYGGR